MKKIFLIVLLSILTLNLTSCESYGVLGQSGVSGSDAKSEIEESYREGLILWWAVNSAIYSQFTSSSSIYTSAVNNTLLVAMVLAGEIAVSSTGLNESEHYTRDSVDDCTAKIKRLVLVSWVAGGYGCKLQKVPMLIQVGETGGKKYDYINIGPAIGF